MKKLTVSFFLLAAAAAAVAQDSPSYRLKDPTIQPGSTVRLEIAGDSAVPFNAAYHELTPEQQAFVKSQYEGMGPDDEPPYPLRGRVAMFKAMREVVLTRQAFGVVEMSVLVGADGAGKSVKIYKTPEPGTAKAVAFILLNQKYKPALCKGQPCEQEFPLSVDLQDKK